MLTSLSTPTQKKPSSIFVSTLVASDEDSHNITIPFNGFEHFHDGSTHVGLTIFLNMFKYTNVFSDFNWYFNKLRQHKFKSNNSFELRLKNLVFILSKFEYSFLGDVI